MSRSLDSLSNIATLFAGPGSASNSSSSVDENVGFRFVLDRTVQTLSKTGLPSTGTLSGLLFVPSLAPEDPCNTVLAPHIPTNVTRLDDVSEYGYPLIGFAPWISTDCTQSLLAASREQGTDALIFFQPSRNETGIPAPASDERWALKDGDKWRTDNHYPVYAIPGPAGVTLMRELSWFSDAQSTSREHDHSSSEISGSESERLFVMLDSATTTTSSPSLWSFVLAILGTIVGLSLILIVLYRVVLRKRRDNLRRRIETGEVDVEHLALNQIKVPREVVDKMPLYVFTTLESNSDTALVQDDNQTRQTGIESCSPSQSSPTSLEKQIPCTEAEITKPKPAVTRAGSESTAGSTSQFRSSHTQTTCAICLDDFVAGSSMVRELPCGHIFDPGCIDTFLTENSSLCPLCKKTVLPTGSLNILVTNDMVRQDHASRHSR